MLVKPEVDTLTRLQWMRRVLQRKLLLEKTSKFLIFERQLRKIAKLIDKFLEDTDVSNL